MDAAEEIKTIEGSQDKKNRTVPFIVQWLKRRRDV
jgi:hypothetical protein